MGCIFSKEDSDESPRIRLSEEGEEEQEDCNCCIEKFTEIQGRIDAVVKVQIKLREQMRGELEAICREIVQQNTRIGTVEDETEEALEKVLEALRLAQNDGIDGDAGVSQQESALGDSST